MSLTLAIITFIILATILIVFAIIGIRRLSARRFEKKMERLERNKNSITGIPIMNELAKVEAILKNEKLESKYNEWYESYNTIKNTNVPRITDMLVEANFLMTAHDYQNLIYKIAKIEMEIYQAGTNANIILAEIREINSSEEKNRNIITEFKVKYRELLADYTKHRLNYGEINKSIEAQFDNIEKQFGKFEKLMDQNDYDEVAVMVKALDEMIKHMGVVVEEVPTIIMLTKNIIPKKLSEISTIHGRMIRDGYNLEYIKYSKNSKEIEKKINDIIARTKLLNLEDAVLECKTISDYLDELYNDLEKEKAARSIFEESVNIYRTRYKAVKELIKDVYLALEEIKYNYDVTPGEIDIIEKLSAELAETDIEYKTLKDQAKTGVYPYSKLDQKVEVVFKKIDNISDKLTNIYKSLNSMKDDEERAKEQLEEIKYLLRQSKQKLRTYKLPEVKPMYHTEMKEAEESIEEIIKVLTNKPTKIDLLNLRVDTARDLVFKLYNRTNEMIKTAMLAEMAIVYGNRYKSSKKNLLEGLNYSEILFNNGNYNDALESAINTIELVEPGIHKKLLNLYSKQHS